ncbi:MerR family transcriptional regulator [Hansschlegelia quercus]|uniref:MerR family transcriptional regulator n=1 Tax=Hansschlegelia quercus TaxID=2528245 RepID=A0A4Q9GRI2_9HYPH|nr:MerR family transcriptional regulator [Hansschlegelia quercus]
MESRGVLLTRKQIAAAYGVDVATVQRWKKRGLLQPEQPGGRGGTWRLPTAAVKPKKDGEG